MKKIKLLLFVAICIALGSIATPYHADDLSNSSTQGIVGFSPGTPPPAEPIAPTPPKGTIPNSPKVNTMLPKTGEKTNSLSMIGFTILSGLTTLIIIDNKIKKRKTFRRLLNEKRNTLA